MTIDMKSAIRFGDFYSVFGPRGVVAMAWWLGSLHADRIREEQQSFPFLHLYGEPGSGKGLLLDYLWKLNGKDYFEACAPDRSSRAARSRFLANANKQVVAFLPEEQQAASDWTDSDWTDELKPMYTVGAEFFNHSRGSESTKFQGAILISSDQPLRCSEAVKSRMQTVYLPYVKADKKFRSVSQLIELSPEQAGAFARVLRPLEEQIIAALQVIVPANIATYAAEFGESLNQKYAKNFAQLAALVEVLSDAIGLPARHRSAALSTLAYSHSLMDDDLPF